MCVRVHICIATIITVLLTNICPFPEDFQIRKRSGKRAGYRILSDSGDITASHIVEKGTQN